MEKSKAGQGGVERWRNGILNGMMKQGLTEKVTFEQRPEGGEGGDHVGTGLGRVGKSILGRETSQCRGPEVGSCLSWVRKTKEANAAGVE